MNEQQCKMVMDIIGMSKTEAQIVFLNLARDFPERAAEIEACFWSARAANSSGVQPC